VKIGLTGVQSDLGVILMDLLREDPRVTTVVSFGLAEDGVPPNTTHVETDLTASGAERLLAQKLLEHEIDVLCHLAFVNSRIHRASFAHELEVIGTLHVLSAAQQANIKRLIVPSLTLVYGAQKTNPTRLKEEAELLGRGVRFVTDRVEVERQVATFAANNPNLEVAVLRFAPIAGPLSDNPLTRLLKRKVLPTILGHDPVWQVLHEDDAAHALHLALFSNLRGPLNIVPADTLAFSSVLRAARVQPLPMPLMGLKFASMTLGNVFAPVVPASMLDFFKFSFVADGSRAETMLGFRPESSCRQALESFFAAQHHT
jgi:UDP-glucose 4-epimerase